MDNSIKWVNSAFNSTSGWVSRYASKAKIGVITTDLLGLVGVQVAGGVHEPHLAGWNIVATQLQTSKLTISVFDSPHNMANALFKAFSDALDPGPQRSLLYFPNEILLEGGNVCTSIRIHDDGEGLALGKGSSKPGWSLNSHSQSSSIGHAADILQSVLDCNSFECLLLLIGEPGAS